MIGDIWTLISTKEKKWTNLRKKELNKRLIKDRIIRDIRAFFNKVQEDYY